MARKKKKAAKKTASVETPPADEPEPVEDDVEPEIADPFDSHEAEDEAAKEEASTEPEAAEKDKGEQKAPAGPPDRATVTFAEKKAQERGEKPSEGDPQKWGIVDFIQNSAYMSEDIEAVDYYAMAGVSVLTMSDGRKFDVTD